MLGHSCFRLQTVRAASPRAVPMAAMLRRVLPVPVCFLAILIYRWMRLYKTIGMLFESFACLRGYWDMR